MNFLRKVLSRLTPKKEKEDLFYSYYLLGLGEPNPIWKWSEWKKYLDVLQPIIDLSPEIPMIKTSQSIPVAVGKKGDSLSYDKGYLRFGKMVWNHHNNEKWTTKYANEERWTFFDTEIAFPTRSHCHKNGGNPDLMIIVKNENLSGIIPPTANQSITIHIKSNIIDQKKLAIIDDVIIEIAKMMNCKIAGKIKRPSSYKSGFGGYTDSIFHGSHGVFDYDKMDFSENYLRYGIKRFFN